MKNYLFILLFISIVVALLSIWLCCSARSQNKDKYKKIIWGAITLILTLIGFFLTIGNEYFAQFDYNTNKIVKEMFYHKDNLNFSEIKVEHKAAVPQYYYFLDVSGSMMYAGKRDLTEHIENKIGIINNSSKGSYNEWTFDVDKRAQKIEFYRLLQVRLMHSILRQAEKHKENFKYSVVLFSGNPSEFTIYSKEISQVFKEIYEKKYDGAKSDFVSLLKYLNEHVVKNASPANGYKPDEYYVVILSDNLHDANRKQNNYDVEQKLLDYLREMGRKEINFRFYFLDGVNNQNGFRVDNIFKSVFPNSPIGVLDVDDELVCPIISKKPLSFFYTNSLFEENLTTCIIFDSLNHKKDFSVGLGPIDNNGFGNNDGMKQEYYLIEGTDTIHLSRYRHLITVDLNDRVELMIKGYIPAPYRSPDIIIHDEKEDVQYIVPVTFYKKFPPTGYFLLFCMVILLVWLFFYLIVKLIEEISLRNNTESPSVRVGGNNQECEDEIVVR